MTSFNPTSLINQTILQSTIIPPTQPISSPLVLETSLTLNAPIMTPLEVPSSLSASSKLVSTSSTTSSMSNSNLDATILAVSRGMDSISQAMESSVSQNSLQIVDEPVPEVAKTSENITSDKVYIITDNNSDLQLQSNLSSNIDYSISSSVKDSDKQIEITPSMPIIDDTFYVTNSGFDSQMNSATEKDDTSEKSTENNSMQVK